NGVVSLPVDFGPDSYRRGEPRWIEVDMRSPAGSGSFTTLVPRQPLTPTPFAVSVRGLDVDTGGNVGVGGNADSSSKLSVNGTARMTGFQLATGAAAGSILTSDANGIGSWTAATCI